MKAVIDRLKPRLRRCSWELTLRCNYRCVHCGSEGGEARYRELTTKQALGVCDALANLGCREVTLLGGEPCLRPDWEVIATRLISLGLDLNIVSNGSCIDREMAERLADAGVNSVGISLDGLEDTHNSIRMNPDAFGGCLRAFDALRGAGVSVCVVTVAMPRNVSELPDMLQLLTSREIGQWQIQLPIPTGRFSGAPVPMLEDLLRDTNAFLVSAQEQDAVRVYAGCDVGYFGNSEEHIRTVNGDGLGFWSGCYAGVLLAGIRSDGSVTGCLALPPELDEGNIAQTGLEEIWNSEDAFTYNRGFSPSQLSGACAACPYGNVCRGGCHAMAWFTSGLLFADPICAHRLESA